MRHAGDEWLITNDMTEFHILDVYEENVKTVYATTLSNRQYCVVLDPHDEEKKCNLYGTKKLLQREMTFFLRPHESL